MILVDFVRFSRFWVKCNRNLRTFHIARPGTCQQPKMLKNPGVATPGSRFVKNVVFLGFGTPQRPETKKRLGERANR